MDNILSLLVSINKISIIGFIITLAFLSYQVYLLVKEVKKQKKNVVIPDFQEQKYTTLQKSVQKKSEASGTKQYKKPTAIPMIGALLLLIVFGCIALINVIRSKNNMVPESGPAPSPVIRKVVSAGIKVYNENWIQLSDSDLSSLKPGDNIKIAIESVQNAGIDMARIRVNSTEWSPQDITLQYDKTHNVYYKDYRVSTGEAYLRINAQLHSKGEGWIGN